MVGTYGKRLWMAVFVAVCVFSLSMVAGLSTATAESKVPGGVVVADDGVQPDPGLAIGLAVMNESDVSLGRVVSVIDQGEEKLAIMTVGADPTNESRTVAVPLKSILVKDGIMRLDMSADRFAALDDFKMPSRAGQSGGTMNFSK